MLWFEIQSRTAGSRVAVRGHTSRTSISSFGRYGRQGDDGFSVVGWRPRAVAAQHFNGAPWGPRRAVAGTWGRYGWGSAS